MVLNRYKLSNPLAREIRRNFRPRALAAGLFSFRPAALFIKKLKNRRLEKNSSSLMMAKVNYLRKLSLHKIK
jgi:hypothetical protein